jgi:hypothetical protein
MSNEAILGQALEDRVLAYLKGKPDAAVGPTEIGLFLKFDYGSASSRIMAPLRRLIASGKVKVAGRGKYQVVADAVKS